MPGALDGIRVIDATRFVFGPVATRMLGDMGADVVKVEPPEGDPTRRIGALRYPGIPLAFGDSPGSIRRGPPRLGEHTAELVGALDGGSATPRDPPGRSAT